MNTSLWNIDSGLAAVPRPGMTASRFSVTKGSQAADEEFPQPKGVCCDGE